MFLFLARALTRRGFTGSWGESSFSLPPHFPNFIDSSGVESHPEWEAHSGNMQHGDSTLCAAKRRGRSRNRRTSEDFHLDRGGVHQRFRLCTSPNQTLRKGTAFRSASEAAVVTLPEIRLLPSALGGHWESAYREAPHGTEVEIGGERSLLRSGGSWLLVW